MKRPAFGNWIFFGAAAVFALVLAGCFGGGGDDSSETTVATTTAGPTVQTLAPPPTVPAQPPTPTAAPAPAPTTAAPAPAPTTAAPAGSGGLTYTVQSGDTLASIADRFNVSVDDIVSANNITNPDIISIGQQFVIPTGSGGTGSAASPSGASASGATGTTSADGSTYTVASGDTLASIANRFNISLDDLLEANPSIDNQDVISIGQVLNIPSS